MGVTRAGNAASGRWINVEPHRLAAWLGRFEERHGTPTCTAAATTVQIAAPDGTVAQCQVPFPPLPVNLTAPDAGLVEHALVERRVGVLLVRMGGHAAGVFTGSRLLASKVGSRNVHARASAGGWSQQRFARRRENQVRAALNAAADVASVVLVPVAHDLDAVILGGDRRSLSSVLQDPRLAALRPLVTEPLLLDVPDPRLRVLERTPQAFLSTRIRVSQRGDPD